MRITAGDLGAEKIQPLFFAIPIRGVVEMDTDEGWLDLIVCDDTGKPLVADDMNGYKIERMTGEVTYEIVNGEKK